MKKSKRSVKKSAQRRVLPSYKEKVTFRLPEDLYESLAENAAEDHRTLSNYIVYILQKHVSDIKNPDE